MGGGVSVRAGIVTVGLAAFFNGSHFSNLSAASRILSKPMALVEVEVFRSRATSLTPVSLAA